MCVTLYPSADRSRGHINKEMSHQAAPPLSGGGAAAILEKKQMLEEDLRRVEKQIYDLEGDYLQVRCARTL